MFQHYLPLVTSAWLKCQADTCSLKRPKTKIQLMIIPKYNSIQNLMWKLSTEQEEFLRFLQQYSLSAKDNYNFLHPQVKKEIQVRFSHENLVTKNIIEPIYFLIDVFKGHITNSKMPG